MRQNRPLLDFTDFTPFYFYCCLCWACALASPVTFLTVRWSRNANWIWPDLAFGFVHKRSGNEIRPIHDMYISVQCIVEANVVARLTALNTTTTNSIYYPLLKSTSRSIAIEMRLLKQLKFFFLCAFLLCLMEPSFVEAQKPPGGVFGEGLQRHIRFVDIFCAFLTLFWKNFFRVNVVP